MRDRIALWGVWIALAATAAAPPEAAAAGAPGDTLAPGVGPTPASEQQQIKRTLEEIGRKEVEGARSWERHKNARIAMLSSAVLPGLGQVYNGRRLKVGILVGFMSFYTGNMVINWRQHKYHEATRDLLEAGSDAWEREDILSQYHEERAIDFLWWSGATWLIGILDAWIDAHLYDVRAYKPDTPGAEPQDAARLRFRSDGTGRYVMLTIDF